MLGLITSLCWIVGALYSAFYQPSLSIKRQSLANFPGYVRAEATCDWFFPIRFKVRFRTLKNTCRCLLRHYPTFSLNWSLFLFYISLKFYSLLIIIYMSLLKAVYFRLSGKIEYPVWLISKVPTKRASTYSKLMYTF